MKCDLHVHTIHSGMSSIPLLNSFIRESYNDPEAVYRKLKSLGMALVTITDHDSIGAADALRYYPDFFLSEEVTSTAPAGTILHVGVYDLTERQHLHIQRCRDDLPRLVAYLSEQRLFYSVNHAFSSLTGSRTLDDFASFIELFPAFETLNGHMLPVTNRAAERLALRTQKTAVAGSDAHALASVGSAFTEVPGARNKAEFFDLLRSRQARVLGSHGSYAKLTRDVFGIGAAMMRERPVAALLALLAPIALCWTFANLLRETAFARHWWAALSAHPGLCRRASFWRLHQASLGAVQLGSTP